MSRGKITKYELHPSLLALIEGKTGIDVNIGDGMIVKTHIETLQTDNNQIAINQEYNKKTDEIMVFENATYMEDGFDYSLSDNGKVIISKHGQWKKGTLIRVFIFKNGKNIILKNSIILSTSTNVSSIGISKYDPKTDDIMVFENSTYIEESTDYSISEDKSYLISKEGSWNSGTLLNYIVFKNSKTNKNLEKLNTKLTENTDHININLKDFNEATDVLLVFQNSLYLNKDIDYTVSSNNMIITSKTGQWKTGTLFNFIIIKNTLTATNKLFDSRFILENAANKVPINIEQFSINDDIIFVFRNGIYVERDTDYKISEDNKYIESADGSNWEAKTKFNIIIINDVRAHNDVYKSHIKLNTADNKATINIAGFNKNTDVLFVFKNSVYMDDTDYSISEDGSHIIRAESSINWSVDTSFNFLAIKNILKSDIIVKNVNTIQTNANKSSINIPKYNKDNDKLIVFVNSVFLDPNDYGISNDSSSIIKTDGEWKSGTKFSYILVRSAKKLSVTPKHFDHAVEKGDLSYDLITELDWYKNTIMALIKRVDELEKKK